jgi:hypothetical protein
MSQRFLTGFVQIADTTKEKKSLTLSRKSKDSIAGLMVMLFFYKSAFTGAPVDFLACGSVL